MPKSHGNRLGRRLALSLGAATAALFILTTAVPTARAATASGWNIITSPNTTATDSNILLGATCTSAWNCWSVGGVIPPGNNNNNNNPQPTAIADHWNGSTWSLGPDVQPSGSQASLLWDVSCVTASDCWAVGAQEGASQKNPDVLAEQWNGSSWSVMPTPDIGGYLFSVSCTSASNCWAVGNSLDAQKNPDNGVILQWNGSQWTQVPEPVSGQPYDQLASVTCTSSSDCWAVGYAGPNQIQYGFLPGVAPNVVGSTVLIDHWNGATWSVTPAPSAASPAGQLLSSVACVNSSTCWAVGTTTDVNGNADTTLVDEWNGSAWSTTPSPAPTTPANLLSTVTCVDATDCWATGATNAASAQNTNNNNTSPTPFIENWNGSAWSVDPSPNVTAFGYLSGLACVRGTGCFAAGFSATNVNNNQTFQTLIEQLQVPAASTQGMWMAGSDGGVFAFGSAGYYGSAGGAHLNEPIVGMAATPDGGGYWLVASDGGVFSYGDASFYGSTGGMTLNKPIVGMAATPDGDGYWLVASDGGVFSFGDATFYGSTGSIVLNKPIVGMAATTDGGGYWLVASDGGVFSIGDAGYDGSVPGQGITSHAPVEGIVATPDGGGYWILGRDGALYSYGDATYLGSLVGIGLQGSITGAATSS
jgi:hypothetical protein